ncbi:MAG: M20/M25/M40 family metallo-hydrolase [Emergencia timonensis]|uniref:M20/M25/M40 family metallo-hydrolase n=1 Tax=Emergencia timonensis TaxID=1776384 RepID=UPI000A7413D1|nr:M20/M25/M40 family metallo-hydrolase [Emergencia timonensis]WNX90333.1 M20/M25/M40 family metallo-hydrolase [Emergencia timonensis]
MELSRTDQILCDLIKMNTISGVYPERPCITYIKNLFDEAGIENRVIALDDQRPNLYACIPAGIASDHKKPPVLFYGHVDVVPVDNQDWSSDPFGAEIKDGYIWGRGAIDMKGEVAMFIGLALQMKELNLQLPFDVRFLFVSDEEGTGKFGASYLVDQHSDIFAGIKWAFGEIGGFTFHVAGKQIYPVMVAEKQFSHIKVTAKGEGGHGSLSHHNTAMEKAARAIIKLSTERLPVRITPAATLMIEGFADIMGGIQGKVLRRLLKPAKTDKTLKLLGSAGELFDPLLHNNANVTIVGGGNAINVIPSAVSFECDLRLVPGCTMEEGIADVQHLIGSDYEIEVVEYNPGSSKIDMSLYKVISQTLIEKEAEAKPVPFVLSGVTDGRFLSKLGIQTYGFTPMKLPEDYNFTALAHAADERIPVGATAFGTEILVRLVKNLGLE